MPNANVAGCSRQMLFTCSASSACEACLRRCLVLVLPLELQRCLSLLGQRLENTSPSPGRWQGAPRAAPA